MSRPDSRKPRRKSKGSGNSDLLDYVGGAKFLRGCTPGTLKNWVSSGLYGIPFVKVGRRVFFRRQSLERWLASRERNAVPEVLPQPSGAAQLEAR